MREASTHAGGGTCGEQHAPRSAMKIQTEFRPPPSYRLHSRRQDRLDIGIALKDRSKPVFHSNRHVQIGPALFEDSEGRRCAHAIAQGTQADYRDPRSGGEMLKRIFHAAVSRYSSIF